MGTRSAGVLQSRHPRIQRRLEFGLDPAGVAKTSLLAEMLGIFLIPGYRSRDQILKTSYSSHVASHNEKTASASDR
jgi:hypothetical protein